VRLNSLRAYVEDYPSIDANKLARLKALEALASTKFWIRIGRKQEWVVDSLATRNSVLLRSEIFTDHHVMLDRTGCNYGGSRTWFRCPGPTCGRRISKLYLRHGLLRCRQCHNLVYESQFLSRLDRALAREKAARWALGSGIDLLSPEAPKPHGMHAQVFERHRQNARQKMDSATEQAKEDLSRLICLSTSDSESACTIATRLQANWSALLESTHL
jgi:hypothetical protein